MTVLPLHDHGFRLLIDVLIPSTLPPGRGGENGVRRVRCGRAEVLSGLNSVSSVSCLVVLHRVPGRITEHIAEIASGEKRHLVEFLIAAAY